MARGKYESRLYFPECKADVFLFIPSLGFVIPAINQKCALQSLETAVSQRRSPSPHKTLVDKQSDCCCRFGCQNCLPFLIYDRGDLSGNVCAIYQDGGRCERAINSDPDVKRCYQTIDISSAKVVIPSYQ